MKLDELIKLLSEINAPSGAETMAAERIAQLLEPLVDELYTDPMGSIIAFRRGIDPAARTLMLTAHMDEIGLIVTGITDEGFLSFDTLGGVDSRYLPAQEVWILARDEEPVYGVIDTMPPHVLAAADMEKAVPVDKLYIDIGLSKEDARELIPLGSAVSFRAPAIEFPNGQIVGKSLDNRISVAIILEALRQMRDYELDINIAVLFAAQEELGNRGAMPGSYSISPDFALVVDATFAKAPDTPSAGVFKLGAGPTIGVGPNMSRGITQLLMSVAEEFDLPYQTEVLHASSGTDAWAVQVSRGGVATALLSPPLRYMHSPVELIDTADAEVAVQLVVELCNRIGGAL